MLCWNGAHKFVAWDIMHCPTSRANGMRIEVTGKKSAMHKYINNNWCVTTARSQPTHGYFSSDTWWRWTIALSLSLYPSVCLQCTYLHTFTTPLHRPCKMNRWRRRQHRLRQQLPPSPQPQYLPALHTTPNLITERIFTFIFYSMKSH